MKRPRRPRPLCYSDAIHWIADNDDTDFLDDPNDCGPSVTLALVADIYGRTTEEAVRDLRNAVATNRLNNAAR